jgi:hypothetical protein
MPDILDIMHTETAGFAAWLSLHGYDVTLWRYSTALNNYGAGHSRTEHAAGFAVSYAGQLVRDDGSRAPYLAGIRVYCDDSQLPPGRLVKAGRALVTSDDKSYTPYYVAGYNLRDTELRRDRTVSPGTLPWVTLHELTPLTGGDGPTRFYDLRLTPVPA